MSAGVALQAVLTGLANGAVYGLVALGFTLVFTLTRVLSFAHGDLVAGAVATGVLLVLGSTPTVTPPGAWSSVAITVLVLVAGLVLSLATYLLVVRPFLDERSRSRAAGWVAGGIVVGLVVRQSLTAVFPRDATAVPDPLHLGAFSSSGVVRLAGGGVVPARLFGVILLGVGAGWLVELALVRTRLGKAMRAVADDADAAALVGIPAAKVVLVAFAVAGLLAGLAGLLAAPGRPLTPDAGTILGLKAVAAALIGRLGSVPGALVGGLLLGVVESLAVSSSFLGPAYADVLALGLLVVVLALRPEGLGSRRARVAE